MKVTVIYNPTAGGGREALLSRFVAELERQGASVRLYYTKGPNDATHYLNGPSDPGDSVTPVAVGASPSAMLCGFTAGAAPGTLPTCPTNVLV